MTKSPKKTELNVWIAVPGYDQKYTQEKKEKAIDEIIEHFLPRTAATNAG